MSIDHENLTPAYEGGYFGPAGAVAPTEGDEFPDYLKPFGVEEDRSEVDVASSESVDHTVSEQGSRLGLTSKIGMHALRVGVIAAEYSPLNEGVRAGTWGWAVARTDGLLVPAIALGGATLLFEGASALGAAKYIEENRLGQVARKIDDWLPGNGARVQKALDPQRAPEEKTGVSWATEALLALSVGSVGAMEARQRGVAERDINEIRRHGLITAGWLSGVLAVGGALGAEGVANVDIQSPITWAVGAGLLTAIGAKSVVNKFKERHSTQDGSEEG